MKRRFWTTTFLVALLSVPAGSQEIGGAIDGTVVRAGGEPVAGAMITAEPVDRGVRTTVESDREGYFRIPGLPVGPVAVTVTAAGFDEYELPEITVRLGRTTSLGEVRLTGPTFELPAMVVEGSAVAIDAYSAAVGDDLLRSEFEDLPLDRDYRNLAILLPEVNVSYLGDGVSFSGATGLDNRYFIDGMDVTDPFRGVQSTILPYNFIEAVEVRSGGYEAEYRSSLGGVLNVVTSSGSDEFRGSIFGFYANNRLAGEPRQGALEPEKGDFASYDLGGTVSGPIARGKAWFALAYNPAYTEEQVEIPGTGLHDDVTRRHSFAGKARWRASDDLDLYLSVVGDPTTRDALRETWLRATFTIPQGFENPDPYLGRMETGSVSTLLRADWFASDKLDLRFDLSYLRQRDDLQPATERGQAEAMFYDAPTAVFSGGFPINLDAVSSRAAAELSGRLYLASHTLSAGLSYRDNGLEYREFQWNDITRYSDDNFQEVVIRADGTVHNRVPSVYLQDSWRINERWRLNAGVRWDGQYLVGDDGRTAQSITDQYQPRLGVIFQPGVPGTQRVTATFGRFYHDLPIYASGFIHNAESVFDFIAYDHDPRQDPTGGEVFIGDFLLEENVDLKGQHYDEFTVGYDRNVGADATVGVRGVYRTLREAVEDANVPGTDVFVWGNPGRGSLSDYPEAKRDYYALVLSAGGRISRSVDLRASYVLSRTEGNYAGLFNSDLAIPFPNYNASFDYLENTVNSDGLLPSDRTHVFKLAGAWQSQVGLTVGTFVTLASGTPLSILEGSSIGSPFYNFAEQRGTAGRTPWLWDVSFRFTYDLAQVLKTSWRPRLVLDVFHVGNPRRAVSYDQVQSLNQDQNGNQIDPNPTYGMAARYQPPVTMRAGLEVRF